MPDRNKTKDRDPKDAADADRRREAAAWKERNAKAIKAHNEWVEQNGLTLEKYQLF
jgi:post-segregation antitoxin (ccd killing protein)